MKSIKIDKMGVYVLLSHLLITIALIGVYTYTLIAGVQDDTLKTILTVIVGYWFGAVGKEAILSKPTEHSRLQDYDNGEVENYEKRQAK